VTARSDGRSALAAFRRAPDWFDIVVTDQTMPRMSGLELAEAVARLRPQTPVVLCTGFSEKVNGRSGGQDAVREFIMKPFTLDEISRAIRKALGKKESGQ
jgi:two-component system cell cycle sensor histidine kinase/response regulator CckA